MMSLYKEEYDDMTTLQLSEILYSYERERHLAFWHDGSTISNHSHLLMTISTLYDPQLFLTDNEYEDIYGKLLCINC